MRAVRRILFWKRWLFSVLCFYLARCVLCPVLGMPEKRRRDSIYCDAAPGALRRDREWRIGE